MNHGTDSYVVSHVPRKKKQRFANVIITATLRLGYTGEVVISVVHKERTTGSSKQHSTTDSILHHSLFA